MVCISQAIKDVRLCIGPIEITGNFAIDLMGIGIDPLDIKKQNIFSIPLSVTCDGPKNMAGISLTGRERKKKILQGWLADISFPSILVPFSWKGFFKI